MAVTPNSWVTPQGLGATSENSPVTFANADSTTPKTIVTGAANGTIVKGVSACTTDTSTNNIQLFLNNGSTSYLIGTVAVVTLSGTNGSANAVNLLNTTAIPGLPIDAYGNPFLEVPSGWVLKAGPLVAVTSAKTLTITPLSVENL